MAAMTPETRAKRAISILIDEVLMAAGLSPAPRVFTAETDPTRDYYSLRSTPTAMGVGSSGRPDMMLSFQHRTVEIEVKAKDNTPSRLQEIWLRTTAATGNPAWVVWGDDPVDMAWFKESLSKLLAGVDVPYLKLVKHRGR